MVIFKVKVKPNSQQQSIETEADGSLKICLKSPPVDGKANQELIKLLAKKFNVKKSEITIKSGLSSKNKLIEILLPEIEKIILCLERLIIRPSGTQF